MGKFKPLRAVCLVLLAAVLISASCGAVSLKLRYKQRRTTRYNVNHLKQSPVTVLGQNANHVLSSFGEPYHKYAKKAGAKIGVKVPNLGQFLQSQTSPETPQLRFKPSRNGRVMVMKNPLEYDLGFFTTAVGRVMRFVTRSNFSGAREVRRMIRVQRIGFRRDFSEAVRSGRIFR